MKTNKIIITVVIVILLVIAGGIYLKSSSDENLRDMGFPSLNTVPDGFSSVDTKTIDTGDWCEVTYENNSGDFLSLDCYKTGTFDTAFLQNYAKSTDKAAINEKEAVVYQNLSGNDNNIRILAWEDEENNALCLLGGNISVDELIQAAESIKYDRKKAVSEPESGEISTSPQEKGMIETDALKKYSEVLENTTKPLFHQYMENDKAISKFEIESFYKSFDFYIADALLVEVFDYDYVMQAKNNAELVGGMQRDDDGNISGFTGSAGQTAAVSRDGQLIKAQLITGQDVKMEPADADEETLDWIKENVMTSVKSPAYLVRNALDN